MRQKKHLLSLGNVTIQQFPTNEKRISSEIKSNVRNQFLVEPTTVCTQNKDRLVNHLPPVGNNEIDKNNNVWYSEHLGQET